MLHTQHFADASRPITIWRFVKTDDIQLVWFEHLTNLFGGRAFAELNIVRGNTNRNGLVFQGDLSPLTVLRVLAVDAV